MLFVAGMVAIVLPHDKPGPTAVKITRNCLAPVGGAGWRLVVGPILGAPINWFSLYLGLRTSSSCLC